MFIYAEACSNAEAWSGKDAASIMGSMNKMLNAKGDWFMNATEAVYYGLCDEVFE
jgi:ATP-dependent protease ClpP protease subunit